MTFVSIIINNKSDYEIMKNCVDTFEKFNVNYEVVVSPAHSFPQRTKEYINKAEEKGAVAFICGVTKASSLSSFVAAQTTKPVISISSKSESFNSVDAVLMAESTKTPVSMPVSSVGLGKTGAINASYLAMQMLAITDKELAIKLKEDRVVKSKKIDTDSKEIEVIL